jgi:hypothetical protein
VGSGSCNGISALVSPTGATGTATYWDATGTQQSCLLSATGTPVDIAVSDVFATTCPGAAALPSTIGDFRGPVVAETFVVPAAATQTVISTNAAYFVFGFGAAGLASPWTDDTQIFIRSAASDTQTILGTAIGVPAAKWKGVTAASSGSMLADLSGSTSPQKAIGILSADVVDTNRTAARILAYQSSSASCGVLPDSSASAFDKVNVRNGTYPLWGREHFFTHVNAMGNPASSGANDVIGFLAVQPVPLPGFDPVALETRGHLVPACAMRVSRSSEMGPLTSFTPADVCNCFFDFTATGSTSCAACTTSADCASPKACHHGFCE